jgi:hypothetical protein
MCLLPVINADASSLGWINDDLSRVKAPIPVHHVFAGVGAFLLFKE